MTRLIAYLKLMRLPNLMTAAADIFMGAALTAIYLPRQPGWTFFYSFGPSLRYLVLASMLLYAGGVVFNDVLDFKLDQVERPERPLPAGHASLLEAILLGSVLFILAHVAAVQHALTSAIIASFIVLLILFYNGAAKHHPVAGPLAMGACRAGNLLLGISIVPEALPNLYPFIGFPLLYIAAVTLVSRGEVHGGNRFNLNAALVAYVIVVLLAFNLGVYFGMQVLWICIYLLFFLYWVSVPLLDARASLKAPDVGKAVKYGVLGLIIFDASLSAGLGGWQSGLIVLSLLPISMALARIYAVT